MVRGLWQRRCGRNSGRKRVSQKMRAIKCLAAVALGAALLSAALGCGGGGGSAPPTGARSNFKLRAVDSSLQTRGVEARAGQQGVGNAVALRVTVDEIRAIPVSGPPVRVSTASQTIDLLKLGTYTVAQADLPPGDYVKLELIVASAEIEFPDGSIKPVTVPSGAQTGLKLPIQFTISDGYNTVLQLDWNTGNSVHCTGNGEWMLRPTALMVTNISQQETVDNVTVTGTSLAPANVEASDTNVGMLKLELSVDSNFARIEALRVELTGTGDSGDIAAVRVWLDGGDGTFDPSAGSEDVVIGEGAYNSATLNLDIEDQTFNAGTSLVLFVAYDIAAGAVNDGSHQVGVSLPGPAALTSPDNITGSFPLFSAEATIKAP